MTDQQTPRRPRRTGAIIVGALALVIVAVTAIGVLTAQTTPTAATSSSPVFSHLPGPTAAPATTGAAPRPTDSASAVPTPTPALTASGPQPTKSAALSSPAAIRADLVAAVTKTEAVQGKANGPGEIAGPAVRFTIRITNRTSAAVNLSNTVVNAYYGISRDPAIPLDGPGASAFPRSVAAGGTATGVFVFNIPTADRSRVDVTVDTSVRNPVVAFQGAVPR
ncbi:MAG: hypothetical protein ACTHMH_02365 [Curtobacterium sp.]